MIVPVKKIRLLTAISEQGKLIEALQHESKFMLFEHENDPSLPSDINNELRAIERGIKALSKYKKKKFFAYHEVKQSEFNTIEAEGKALLSKINSALKTIENAEKEIAELQAEIKTLTPYLNLSVATKPLSELVRTRIVIGQVPLNLFEDFAKEADEKGHIFEESSRDHEFVYGAFGYEVVYESQALILLNSYRFTEVTLPLYDTKLKALLPELNDNLANNDKAILEAKDSLKALSNDEEKLRIYYDYYYNLALRKLVVTKTTERVAYVEGWVREDEFETLTKNLENKVDCDIEELAVQNEEMVPTATKNNKLVKPFESITNMFSVPNPNELDPNPAMSVWYWIIFGIMMGDMGYGLALLIIFGLFLKLAKPKGGLKDLATIFLYSSIPSIIFGILTGSFFGVSVDLLNIVGKWFGNPNLTSVVLQPVEDPLPMLIFSLALGIAHIITGLVLKIINDARKRDIKSMLADAVSWILILVGLVIAVVVKNQIVLYVAYGMIGIGAIFILLFSGRDKKGIIGKALAGLGGLYNVTSYLSDVLSYSRLLALSLSTAVIAFTMNLLAGMVGGIPVVGILFAAIVYLIGHVFNFAMGLLSAYVHDGRLQYLEFFGKFYEGGGYEFTPFSYKLKYVNAIKENE
ncbi:MAG TPA: V-type ATP synthase subunit I [Bacilli bacterium]|jgi:V/A-type H+-transporting ATPase subunit I|nr:V-type ATP synthase subunit I [Bacilli bacterium]HPY78527.1 V-type ATP synthase subunit I [Bacilli bacterium]